MNRRVSTDVMVRAMGMGMDLLKKLTDEVGKQGGDPEVLNFLTRPKFKQNLTHIAQTIARCDWRIPASEMRDHAEKCYRKNFEFDKKWLEEVRNVWWFGPMDELGLPYQHFNDDDIGDAPHIPHLIREWLDGVEVHYPIHVVNTSKIVVDIGRKSKGPLHLGDRIVGSDLLYVSIAEARYFDFDK